MRDKIDMQAQLRHYVKRLDVTSSPKPRPLGKVFAWQRYSLRRISMTYENRIIASKQAPPTK